MYNECAADFVLISCLCFRFGELLTYHKVAQTVDGKTVEMPTADTIIAAFLSQSATTATVPDLP